MLSLYSTYLSHSHTLSVLLLSASPFLGHLHCHQLIHRFLVLIFISPLLPSGLPIWVFASFGSSVATFVGCRRWLGQIVGHGGGGWVAKMIYGLLWWLCCGGSWLWEKKRAFLTTKRSLKASLQSSLSVGVGVSFC